jgi:sodium/potassium-transporting ATPase subunit alpha
MFVTDFSLCTDTSAPSLTKDTTVENHNGSGIQQLRAVAGLCNGAKFDTQSTDLNSERRIFGDATDQACLRFSETLGSVTELYKHWTTYFELAFDSKNKFMIKAFMSANSQGPSMCLSTSEAKDFNSGNMYVPPWFIGASFDNFTAFLLLRVLQTS